MILPVNCFRLLLFSEDISQCTLHPALNRSSSSKPKEVAFTNFRRMSLGACAMTTKFLTKKKCHGISQRQTAFLDNFPLCPQCPTTLRTQFYVIVVFAVSESRNMVREPRGSETLFLTTIGQKIITQKLIPND